MPDSSPHLSYLRTLRKEVGAYEGSLKKYLRLAPGLYNMFLALLDDKRIKERERRLIGISLGYLLAPYDIIPEDVHGPQGYIDDVYLSLYCLSKIRDNVDDEILRDNWEEADDIIMIIDEYLPALENQLADMKDEILDYVGLE